MLSSCAFQILLEKCSQKSGVNKVGDGGMEYQRSVVPSFMDFLHVFTAPGHPRVVFVPKVSGKGSVFCPVPPTLAVDSMT